MKNKKRKGQMILEKKLWKQLIAIIVVCVLVVGTADTSVAFAADNQENNVTATVVNLSENADDKATNEDSTVENIKPKERTSELDKILKECKEIKIDDEFSREIKRGQMISVQRFLGLHNKIAIMSNGDLYCWGYNWNGEVGNGTTENQTTPVKVLNNVISVTVCSSSDYSSSVAAITSNGDLYCWGHNEYGQVGNGTTENQTIPVKVLSNVTTITFFSYRFAAFAYFPSVAAITSNGDLYCWGYNEYGQVGNGTTEVQTTPVKVLNNVTFVTACSFSDYSSSVAAITSNGDLYCWGHNEYGQVGNGTTENQTIPVKVLSNVIIVDSFSDGVTAITNNGDLYYWGRNYNGEAGNGTTEVQTTPVKVLGNVTTVTAYSSFVAAITSNGDLYCWGHNWDGEVGNGTTEVQTTPVKVLSNVTTITTCSSFVAAITSNGDLYCWGYNGNGQVGNGTTENQTTPVKVLGNVTTVTAYPSFVTAITSNGDLYCWGYNGNGQVGNGTTENQTTPVKVLSNVTTVTAYSSFVAAITSDEDLYCWGYNEYGQVGNGTIEDQTTPIKVLSNVTTVTAYSFSAYSFFVAAITSNGDLYCWGDNRPTPFKVLFKDSFDDKEEDNTKFTLDDSVSCSLNETIKISGLLTLPSSIESPNVLKEIDNIEWISSDSSIAEVTACNGIKNPIDDYSAALDIFITSYKEGTVTITGTTLDGITVSCVVTVEEDNTKFTLDDSVSGSLNKTIKVSGSLTLPSSIENPDILKEIDNIKWTSSDSGIAEVTACDGIKNTIDDYSAILDIFITSYKEGTVTITGTTPDGTMASCNVMISNSEDIFTADYTEDMMEFLASEGTFNTLKYLCRDSNFTNSIFVYENDSTFGSIVENILVDAIYRGYDGWKDLFTSETSVEDAEKILVSLLECYKSDCEELARAKTAKKYSSLIVKAFNEYIKTNAIITTLSNEDFLRIKNTINEEAVTNLLIKQKYDKLIITLLEDYDISCSKEVNEELMKFMDSKEVADSLSNGLKFLGTGLEILSITQDTVNKFYEMESLYTANEMYCEMLLYLKQNCTYNVVQKAAENLYKVIQYETNLVLDYLVTALVEQSVGLAVDIAVDAALDAFPIAKIIKSGFDWGVTISNTFLHTGDVQKLKDSMRTEAYIGNCLSRWVLKNYENFHHTTVGTSEQNDAAKRLYYSLYMLWKTRAAGETTLQNMMKKAFTSRSEYYTVSKAISNTLDSFQDSIFTKNNMKSLLEITISCPVDVEVYDNTGKLLTTVKDGQESSGDINGIYYFVCYQPFDDDYVKYIYFAEDSGYTIKCIGKDLGLVGCSISSITDKGTIKQKFFNNIEIHKDTLVTINSVSSNTERYIVTNPDTNETKEHLLEIRGTNDVEVENIILSDIDCKIKVGDKKLITAEVLPRTVTYQNVTWLSDNDKIVTVNSDGVITAISTGTAIVTSFIDDVKATCRITVTNTEDGNNTDLDDNQGTGGNTGSGSDSNIGDGTNSENGSNTGDNTGSGNDSNIGNGTGSGSNSNIDTGGNSSTGGSSGTENSFNSNLGLGNSSSSNSNINVGSNNFNGNLDIKNDTDLESEGNNVSSENSLNTGNNIDSDFNSETSVETIDISNIVNIVLSKESYIYNGKERKPNITVNMDSVELTKDTDYALSYENNMEVGTASVVVTGEGKYTGTVTKNFTIIPKGTIILGKIAAKRKGFIVKWKKQSKSTTGYQVQYSTNKKFKKKKTVVKTVKKIKTTKLAIENLKAKKKYYIRVRTYKTVNGKNYYSNWSKVKNVTTKKS